MTGNSGFFYVVWGIYSILCVVLESDLYPGAQQYIADYFAFISDLIPDQEEIAEEEYQDPTTPVHTDEEWEPPTHHE